MGFAILKNTEYLFEGTADLIHPIHSQTNFRLASISKQFTAAAIVILINNKEIKYSDSLAKFYPEFNPEIRIEHLLNHTSGLWNYESMIPENAVESISDDMILEWLKNTPSMYFKPGTQFKYSNGAYCILSRLVEKVSGQSFPTFMKENIFEPCQMKGTLYLNDNIPHRAYGYKKGILNDQSITSATQGDGCIYSSVSDYNQWINALQNHFLFHLEEEIKKCKQTINKSLSYSLGWFVHQSGYLYHTGSTAGFSHVSIQNLNKDERFLFFSNENDYHTHSYKYINQHFVGKNIYNIDEILNLTD